MNSLPLPRPSMALTLMQWPSQLLDSVIGRPQKSAPLTTIFDNYPGPEEDPGPVRTDMSSVEHGQLRHCLICMDVLHMSLASKAELMPSC